MRRLVGLAAVGLMLGGVLGGAQNSAPADDAARRKAALSVLDRASGLFSIYGARAGTALTVVTELTPQAVQRGRWKNGADLEVTASAADGDSVGAAHGRIGAGVVTTVLAVPVSKTPVRVTVHVRDGQGSAADWAKIDDEPAALVGDPMVYRSSSRIDARPVADFEFARRERIRIDWPVSVPLDTHDVRLLDRNGRAIPVELPLAADADHRRLTLEMGLSGFGAGDYLIELTARAHGISERRLLAIRVK
ncbi:MAG: hypothetical protein ACRD1V_01710 [Vicinamibacterales bacterium]